MKLAIITAHAGASSLPEAFRSWTGREFDWRNYLSGDLVTDPPVLIEDGSDGMLQAYQRGFLRATVDVLAFVHDDCLTRDPPDQVWPRVLAEFDDPTVGLVGFGGALVHGSPDLYKTPYRAQQLGRGSYLSNVDDAEVHGERFEGTVDVAVLDGFALVVRREILARAGGWHINTPVNYICYDYYLACMVHRLGYRIRLVGVRCHHYGGRTAVALKHIPPDGAGYEEAHRYIYETFRSVLPWDARTR